MDKTIQTPIMTESATTVIQIQGTAVVEEGAPDKTIQMSIMTESVTIAQQKKAQVEGEASAAETKNNR